MPSTHVCFWLEPTEWCEASYRRYVSSMAPDAPKGCGAQRPWCPGGFVRTWDYHNKSVVIDRRERGERDIGRPPSEEERADMRWPKNCDCGYVFQPADEWRFHAETLYRRSDNGELVTLHNAPVGAVWNADWFIGTGHNPKPLPDGRFIAVRCPAGDWLIDGPSSNNNGQGWTRRGEPPLLVVTPSIGMTGMHGWLGGPGGDQPGILVIDQP